MKRCLCCHAECAADAPHCLRCGEASFSAAALKPEPEAEPVVDRPRRGKR